jgi:hypothetical protein
MFVGTLANFYARSQSTLTLEPIINFFVNSVLCGQDLLIESSRSVLERA